MVVPISLAPLILNEAGRAVKEHLQDLLALMEEVEQ